MIDVDAIIEQSRDEPDDSKKRIAALEKQIEEYEQQIQRHRKPRIRINPGRIPKADAGDYVRVIIPDTHGCFIDHDAAGAMLADLEILQPKEIIMLGDHLDCAGFLAQHHTLGFVPECDYSFDDDIDAANAFIDRIQSTAPQAKIDYLYGNHEERIEKWCVKQTLNNPKDAERMRQQNAPEYVLNLAKRGINWVRLNKKYDGLSVPGTIKRGHCYFTHGHRHGRHAAAAHLAQFNGNLVFGHIHRIQSYAIRTVSSGTVASWSVGCLCDLQPMYMNRNQTDWCHGYGVQFCQEGGAFSHITVHIIDGQSYLMPFVNSVSV